MGKRALIVVDMQNDFLTGTLALSGCPAKQVCFYDYVQYCNNFRLF